MFFSQKLKVIFSVFGGVIVLGALGLLLYSFIVSGNDEDCKKIGLKGDLVSCSVDENYAYDKVAILVGNTANSPAPKISEKNKKYIVNSYFKNRDNEDFKVDIYSATPSMPRISYRSNIEITGDEELSAVVDKYSKIVEGINSAMAVAPEEDGVDYYNSIINLGKKLSNDDAKKTLLIVMGSGLSDCGPLNFASNGINPDVNEVISKVNEADKINTDALSGVKLIWSYLGQVEHPQIRLPNSDRDVLKKTYERLTDKMGAKAVDFDEEINDQSAVKTNHKVAVTNVKDTNVSYGTREYKGDSSVFSFDPGKDTLLNLRDAKNELDELAIELNSSSNKIVRITSYQARLCTNDSGAPDSDLLKRRSNAIKNILIEKGVSSSKIITDEGGYGGSATCEDQNDRRVVISVSNEGRS